MDDPITRSPLRSFLDLLTSTRLEYLAILLVLSLVAGGEGIVHPLLIKNIFDEGVIRGNFGRFVFLTVAYVTFGLIIVALGAVTAIWSRSLENRIVRTTSRRMLQAYYEKDYGAVLLKGHGYFINRINGDVQEGLVPLLRLIQTATRQGVLVVASLAVLIYLSWRAFLILAALIPVAVAVSALLSGRIRALTSQEREQEGALLALLTKALNAFRIVSSFRLVPPTLRRFDRRLDDYLLTSYRRYKTTRVLQAFNSAAMNVSDFFSMFVGALFVLRGALTFGGYLAFVNTFWRTVTTLMQLLNYIVEFQRFAVVTNRITSFLSQSEAMYFQRGEPPSLHDVTFSYGETVALKNVSLNFSPGEKVIIVGPNGSGKTTLANILSGFLAPSGGDVVLPERISSITLPISFPPVKVRDLFSDPSILRAFGLGDELILEAFADELSSGQQQKIALCLALSRPADLYIIDEPLANLDQQSRDAAVRLLFDKTKGKTLILVMHGFEEYYHLFDRVIDMNRVKNVQGSDGIAVTLTNGAT